MLPAGVNSAEASFGLDVPDSSPRRAIRSTQSRSEASSTIGPPRRAAEERGTEVSSALRPTEGGNASNEDILTTQGQIGLAHFEPVCRRGVFEGHYQIGW